MTRPGSDSPKLLDAAEFCDAVQDFDRLALKLRSSSWPSTCSAQGLPCTHAACSEGVLLPKMRKVSRLGFQQDERRRGLVMALLFSAALWERVATRYRTGLQIVCLIAIQLGNAVHRDGKKAVQSVVRLLAMAMVGT